ncbi:MAG TPA: DHA2 family efflux MFS transporter permease subunit [Geodermatophilus sp.]|nr:DHA2 family efflux MFS transporter permease subunit [Geodermatophilus sp.]
MQGPPTSSAHPPMPPSGPPSALPPSRTTTTWAPLVLLCAIGGIVVLDYSIVFVAVPSIVEDLGVPASLTPWIANAYALTFGALLLLGGRLGDVLGRRRVLGWGIVLFTVSSAACGLAGSTEVLLASRVVQGVGAALLAPAALALVTTVYREQPARGRAIGAYGAVAGAAGAFGTVLGGVLTEVASWHWAFLVNVPLGIVAVLLAPRLLPADGGSAAGVRGLDVPGAVLATLGLFALVLGVSRSEEHGFAATDVLLLFAAALGLLAAFVLVERRTARPLVRLSIFRLRGVSVGNGVYLVAGAATFGALFLLSLYLQQVLGYDAVQAGLAVVPLAAGSVVSSVVATVVVRRLGARAALVAGFLALAAGMLALSRVGTEGAYLTEVLPGSLLTAAGLGLVIVPITGLTTADVGPEEAGLASGLFSTAQELGGVLGLAVLSAIATSRAGEAVVRGAPEAAAQVEGLRLAFEVAAGAALAALVIAVVFLPRARRAPAVRGPAAAPEPTGGGDRTAA